MAWTAPRTWVAAETVTAALLNTHLRDNLLETAVAKVTTQGDIVYATAANALARLAKGTAGQELRMNSGATVLEWFTPPNVRAVNNTTQSIANNTITAISLQTETAGFDSEAMHDTVTNNSRLTCVTAGKFLVIGNLAWAANATGYRVAFLKYNGSTYFAEDYRATLGAGDVTAQIVVGLISLAVSDYVELWGVQTSLSGLNASNTGNGSCSLAAVRVG